MWHQIFVCVCFVVFNVNAQINPVNLRSRPLHQKTFLVIPVVSRLQDLLITRSCTTPNGSPGNCIQSKECSYMYELLHRKNLRPEETKYIKLSECGLDLDNSKLYCCDNKYVRPVTAEQVNITYRNDQTSSPKTVVVEDEQVPVQEVYSRSSTTPSITTTPRVAPSQIITTTVKPQEQKIIYCHTPNGEKAQCVSIYQCQILLSNVLPNSTEAQKRFLKESRCGFDGNRAPLVCCGSDTNFKYEDGWDGNANFRENSLLPVGYCGIQKSEIEEQRPVPEIKQRSFQNSGTTNFTLPNRIFGGMNSELVEFPWIALLSYETHDRRKMFGCGGSLISSRYILTAAHCVSGQSIGNFTNKLISIRLGEWDFSNTGRDCVTVGSRTVCNEEDINIGIESIYPHPGYKATTREKYHDIALIRLDRDVKFTDYVRPICLPNIDDYVSPGDRLTISGWGLISYNEQTTIKQKVEVPVVSKSQCSIMFENLPRLSRVGRGQFCAGGEDGKDACVGDSGSPLMKKVISSTSQQGLWYIEGIVSFGAGCGLVDHYGVYTKVSEYLGWIHNTIKP